ncbi:hypothetical protein [Streptomyces sp. NPDC006552]|uniref:hypothetical protein n=1 Tax=Streptomyces sp. NPDC006552 TaxID=3157179 RepID=UPI0033B41E08
MGATAGFRQAIQRVPAGSDAAGTAAVMGEYFPRAAYCDLATLVTDAPDACRAP